MGTNANVIVIGSGGVGTMAAYALESGAKAAVTTVCRSNYADVSRNGYDIDSIEHGSEIRAWKPTAVLNAVPDVSAEGLTPYDFIVVTTKNVPDVEPTVVDIIAPAVTPGHSTILLLQNGLNIEKPIIERFPNNTVLSGVSLIGATEYAPGKVRHDDKDRLKVGVYSSPRVPSDEGERRARQFVTMYSACGKVDCTLDDQVAYTRWRKLLYNSSYNSIAAILGMDTCRMRIYDHIIADLVRPAMLEIKAIALAAGVKLEDDLVEFMINVDPIDTFFMPSMGQDALKGNYMEYENIVGEPLREAQRLNVAAPTLTVIYGILKGMQTKFKEQHGLVKPVFGKSNSDI